MAGRGWQVTSTVEKLIGEVAAMTKAAAGKAEHRYKAETKPRLELLLQAAAVVEIRALSGEDVTTARTALESSTLSLAREERAHLILDGRELALSAAISLIGKLAAAAAGV